MRKIFDFVKYTEDQPYFDLVDNCHRLQTLEEAVSYCAWITGHSDTLVEARNKILYLYDMIETFRSHNNRRRINMELTITENLFVGSLPEGLQTIPETPKSTEENNDG